MSETRPAREVRRNAPAPRKGRPQEIEAAQVEYYSDVVEVAGGVSSGSQRCLHLHACAGRPRGSWVLDAHYLPSILNVCCHVRVTVPPLDAGHFSLPSRRLGMASSCDAGRGRPDCLRRVRPAFWKRDGRIPDSRKRRGCDRVVGNSDAIGARGEYRSTSTTLSTRSFGAGVGGGCGRRRSRPPPRSSRPTSGSSSRACPRLASPTAGATDATAATSPRVSGTFRRAVLGAVPGGELLPLHPHLRSRERVLSPVGPQRVRGGSNEDRPARCACAAGDRSSFLTMLYQNVSSP
jgi:hypothetical protein